MDAFFRAIPNLLFTANITFDGDVFDSVVK
jgi:hypothetical protein